jgi:two-component system LytT family response regulator
MNRRLNIRTVIIDDEPLARERIRSLLSNEPDINIVGEYSDGVAAYAYLRRKRVDLLFLDIQMPEMDGFTLMEMLGGRHTPHVIFITAYDTFAVKAFDKNAIDYLLKPFDRDRFHRALERMRERFNPPNTKAYSERLHWMMQDFQIEKKYMQRIIIKSHQTIKFLPVEDIDWIESADNYVSIHAGKKTYMLRATLHSIEQKLDPARFLRIHRRTIVRASRVAEYKPDGKNSKSIILTDGTHLSVSRSYNKNLLGRLR